MFTHDEVLTADRLLTTTKAVRKRLDLTRPVDRETVMDCLRVALQAPNAGNAQRWRWLVIDDPEVRAALGAIYRRALTARLAPDGQELDERVSRSSIEHLALHMHEVPIQVVPCTLDRFSPRLGLTGAASLFGSVLPAAWSFMLALHARGLGSVWTTVHLDHEEEAAALLGLPPRVTQVGLIAVGHVLGDGFTPGERKPVEEVTYWNRWPEVPEATAPGPG